MNYTLLAIFIAMSSVAVHAQQQPFTERETREIVRNHMDLLRAGAIVGDAAILRRDPRLHRRSVREAALPYLADRSERVRSWAALLLAEYGNRDVVMPLACAADDEDHNVRSDILGALRHLPMAELKVRQQELLPLLIKAGRRLEIESCKAIYLIAELGVVEAMPELRMIRQEIQSGIREGRDRRGVLKALDETCACALGKLGDKDAIKECARMFEPPDVSAKVKGIDWVRRIGPNAAVFLVPLLDDKRDAAQIGSIWSKTFARVCDLAAYQLAASCGLKPSFALKDPHMTAQCFTDDQIKEIKELFAKTQQTAP